MEPENVALGALFATFTWMGLLLLSAFINATMFAFTGYWWTQQQIYQAMIIAVWVDLAIFGVILWKMR